MVETRKEASVPSCGSERGVNQELGMQAGADPVEVNRLRYFFDGTEAEARQRRVGTVLLLEHMRVGSMGTAETVGVP